MFKCMHQCHVDSIVLALKLFYFSWILQRALTAWDLGAISMDRCAEIRSTRTWCNQLWQTLHNQLWQTWCNQLWQTWCNQLWQKLHNQLWQTWCNQLWQTWCNQLRQTWRNQLWQSLEEGWWRGLECGTVSHFVMRSERIFQTAFISPSAEKIAAARCAR